MSRRLVVFAVILLVAIAADFGFRILAYNNEPTVIDADSAEAPVEQSQLPSGYELPQISMDPFHPGVDIQALVAQAQSLAPGQGGGSSVNYDYQLLGMSVNAEGRRMALIQFAAEGKTDKDNQVLLVGEGDKVGDAVVAKIHDRSVELGSEARGLLTLEVFVVDKKQDVRSSEGS